MGLWQRIFGTKEPSAETAKSSTAPPAAPSEPPPPARAKPVLPAAPGPLTPVMTALMLAARENQLDKLISLIAAGQNVNAVFVAGKGTAASMAAYNGNATCLDALIQAGANVNYVSKGVQYGFEKGIMSSPTILMMAASGGHIECIKTLCAANVEIDARDDNGLTALMIVASKGYFNCVQELVNAGANKHLADNEGRTALSYASSSDVKSMLSAE